MSLLLGYTTIFRQYFGWAKLAELSELAELIQWSSCGWSGWSIQRSECMHRQAQHNNSEKAIYAHHSTVFHHFNIRSPWSDHLTLSITDLLTIQSFAIWQSELHNATVSVNMLWQSIQLFQVVTYRWHLMNLPHKLLQQKQTIETPHDHLHDFTPYFH